MQHSYIRPSSHFAQLTELVSKITANTFRSCVILALGFSFLQAASKSDTKIFIKCAGSYINMLLKYVRF